jgi:hypothetical protein
LLFNFALIYSIRKNPGKPGLKLKGTYTDDINLFGDNTYQKEKQKI